MPGGAVALVRHAGDESGQKKRALRGAVAAPAEDAAAKDVREYLSDVASETAVTVRHIAEGVRGVIYVALRG